MTWKFRKDNECFEYNGDFVPNQYVANSLNAYLQEFGRLEKEVVELKAENEQLKKTSIKIGEGSKVGNIQIGSRKLDGKM